LAEPVRNLLEMVPERNREWRLGPDGAVRVLEPRFGASRLGRWLAERLGAAPIEVRLDPLGTAVWEACDGATTVGDVLLRLQQRFGPAIEPADERLARFLRELERTRFITWKATSPAPGS
jgi:Coenzyme PQQ synthesis protein D (PqqD)